MEILFLSCTGVIFILLIPKILKFFGLHPDYIGTSYSLPGKKALIIATNQAELNKHGKTGGKATGAFASEITAAYYDFIDASMQVDIASIKGGKIPIEPQSLSYFLKTSEDKRFLQDPELKEKVKNSKKITDIDFTTYDIIFLAGGWGAAYDLGYSDDLGQKISDAYYTGNSIIGGVCHGPLGLIRAKDKDGNLLIAGRRMTAVTDKQIKQLFITATPQHPEAELRKAGALFESQSKLIDMFATHVVTDDEKRFVTGQNQNSGHETAHKMMGLLEK
jgi:putative intracellular protease/amidase